MKTFITLISIFISFYLIGIFFDGNVRIPEESIRLRVLANSNDEYDQEIKKEVALALQDEISNILTDEDNIDTAKTKLKQNIAKLDYKINNIFSAKNYNRSYNINLGLNYFPQKEFKGITYNEGYYESVLVTIGEGKGNNWWCVLFPPLCVLEAEESDNIEYTSLVKEIIDNYK